MHVEKLKEAIANGIDIKGYFYWSSINYEWFEGLSAKFGLFRVDENTLEKTHSFCCILCIFKENV